MKMLDPMIATNHNWKVWHWPWHSKSYDKDYKIYSHFGGFGPFQWHWYSMN